MSLGDVLVGILDHGGSAILASALTAGYLDWRGVRGTITADDRRVHEYNEDLRRWMRDRDRDLSAQLDSTKLDYKLGARQIETDMGVSGLADEVGFQLNSLAEVVAGEKASVLQEYRDEASRKLRAVQDLEDGEGRLHHWMRRRTRNPFPALHLTDDGRRILASWRAPVPSDFKQGQAGWRPPVPVDDPSSADLEPALAALEREPESSE